MKNNELKVDSLCAYCQSEVSKCTGKAEFHKDNDNVINCTEFKITGHDAMWFLKRCKRTLRLCFKSDTKVLINFNKCHGDEELNAFGSMLKELFKEFK